MDAVALFDPVSSAVFLKPAAKELGFKVVGVFTKPIALFCETFHTTQQALFSGCDELVVAESKEEILEKLKRSKFFIRGVIAGIDSGTGLADEISHELHLWSNPLELSNARRDKGAMRELLKRKGLSCPDFRLCHSKKELLAFAEKHTFPLVIKTPKGAATSQVYVCNHLEELVKNFHAIMEEKDFYGRHAEYAVVEEYICGKEYVVNTFSSNGNVYATDLWVYEKIDTDSFKNVYYNIISLPVEDPASKPLANHAIQLVKAFGIERGAAHLEIKDDPKKGPILIEINPRLAGARMSFLLKEHSNFDPYKKSIEVFVKGKTEMPSVITLKKHCAIALCPLLEGGKVEKIMGIELVEKLDSYESHLLNIKPGDTVTPTSNLTGMPFIVFLAHSNRAELLRDLEQVHALFSVSFRA